jgi:acetyltransferase
VVRSVGNAGIENVVVITAGFSEAGTEGAARERELVEIAETYGLNLVGPNCLGVMGTTVGLNATFSPTSARPGSISFMSQSGAFVTAVLDWASDRHAGFRNVVSLGNKAVLDEADFIEHWGDDPETDVVLGYLEDIGDGRAFIDATRAVTDDPPVVVVKSGRTEAGASAAASHTGAMAGSERAYEAGLDQAGAIRVDRAEQLFDYAAVLSGQPLPDNDRIAIVTNAGGPGVMTTDAVGDSSLELAQFEDETLSALADLLPEGANIYNPVDIIGDAAAERFESALDTVLADDSVGLALVLACPTAPLSFGALAEAIVATQQDTETPVVASLMGGSSTEAAADTLSEAGIPTYFDPARAVDSLDALAEYSRIREQEYAEPRTFDVDHDRARATLERAVERGHRRVGVEGMELLEAYGIPTPDGAVVNSPDGAVETAERIGDDVVMKIVSPDISHKSDIGGVEVGVALSDVRDTYEDLLVRAENYQPDATIIGVQVQELVDTDTGTETIVGMTRDPQFGPLVMFGLGGIFVEVMEDTSFRVAPVSPPDAESMLEDEKSSPLLYGARGREPADVEATAEVIERVSQLVTDFPAITELDLNPVVAMPDGVVALDLRLTLDTEKL